MSTPSKSIAVVVFALLAAGCSKDVTGSCERITEACHDKDTGSGDAHECHELAEAAGATDESCSEKEDDCVAKCEAAP